MYQKHFARIDLNLFVVFDVIYREGNLTRAAEQLNLSQPAVSHALGRLRECFNDPLFERAGRGVAPTPLAKAIIGRVRTALQGWKPRSPMAWPLIRPAPTGFSPWRPAM